MWIKEIIIDGFKSYSRRIHITGLDSKFNAITGLNGSGKSNIIDAICFALGLSSLSLARASSLQELIYQNGTAGVAKASVTLIFDNSDIRASPVGYEASKTISIMLNKCKYMLDGHVVTQQKIKGLLKTLHLNIDNPHFMVSQGRITSMINLKPVVLASLIEETAGTSLYKEKRQDANRILEKKDEKLRQVNTLIKTEIEPNLEKLKREKELYQKFQGLDQELAKFKRFRYAHEYYEQRKLLDSANMDLSTDLNTEREMEKRLKTIKEKLEKLQLEQRDLLTAKTRDEKHYTDLKRLCKTQKKEFTGLEFEIQNLERNFKEAEREKEKNSKRIADLEADIIRLDQKIGFSESNLEKQTKDLDEKKVLLDQYETHAITVEQGHKVTGEDKLTLQLKENELKLKTVDSEIKRYDMKKTHLMHELTHLETKIKESSKLNSYTEKELNDIETEISYLQRQISVMTISESEYQNFSDQLREEKTLQSSAQFKLNEMLSNTPAFKLNYKDPERGFDRKKVIGRVFHLFSISDTTLLKAIEAIAKPFLQHIVVDHQNTAKILLKNKSFGPYRVNLIPNDGIVPRVVNEAVINQAKAIGAEFQGQVALAVSLIKFEKEYLPTMQYIFGDVFICSSTEIAQKVAFHNKIRRRCVNLEGDIFDPAGTLSGGFQNTVNSLLKGYSDYRKVLEECSNRKTRIRDLQETCDQMKEELDKYNKQKNEIDMRVHRKELIEKKIRSDGHAKFIEKREDLILQLKDLGDQIEMLIKQKINYEKELEVMKKQGEEFSNNKQNPEYYLKNIGRLREEQTKLINQLKITKADKSNFEVEKESAIKELEKKKNDIGKEEETLQKIRRTLDISKKTLDEAKTGFTNHTEERKQLNEALDKLDEKLKKIENEIAKNQAEKVKFEIGLPKMVERLNKHNQTIQEAQAKITSMERLEHWLISEYKNFGVHGTEYDFDNMDIEKERLRFETMKEEKERLSKRVKFDIEATFAKLTGEFEKLQEKKKILEGDKKIILVAIDRLDRMRSRSLDNCFKIVNKHFGKIFSTFLPGTDAKLEPVKNNMQIDDGVQIAFAFNGVWKNSLSELSGGQRSLLALSYLLAMLLYKPAPFYILDEIDAALDLSHTENIGGIFSKHFSQSQFILITLKEELYKHANTLYKVYLKHGHSEIERLISKSGKFTNPEEEERRLIGQLE